MSATNDTHASRLIILVVSGIGPRKALPRADPDHAAGGYKASDSNGFALQHRKSGQEG
jgi:hypothetical protein